MLFGVVGLMVPHQMWLVGGFASVPGCHKGIAFEAQRSGDQRGRVVVRTVAIAAPRTTRLVASGQVVRHHLERTGEAETRGDVWRDALGTATHAWYP